MHYIVIGLGNPHAEYSGTRHNLGADALVDIAARHHLDWSKEKKYLSATLSLGEHTFDFITPETYMNRSGEVFSHMNYVGKEIVVIYDDLDLPFGEIKISFDRSSGGHNGLASLIETLGTREFTRIRVGIIPFRGGEFRKPKGEEEVEKHILGSWNSEEKEALPAVYKKIEEILVSLSRQGLAQTMTMYN